MGFVRKYVFSTDHKIIGIQFLCTTLLMLMVGGALALGVRWQLAFPWESMPFFGRAFAEQGGQISPEFYTMLFTMHATVMIFLVIIPILAGAFGNFLIPLQIGADDMAFPVLNMLSYWFMWPAIASFFAAFFTAGYGAGSGWTSYPLLSALQQRVSAASSGVNAARSGYLPRVSGQVRFQRSGPNANLVFTDPARQNAVTAGVGLQWDLFSGLGTLAEVRQAQAARSAAELNLAQAERDVEADVKRNLSAPATKSQNTRPARITKIR